MSTKKALYSEIRGKWTFVCVRITWTSPNQVLNYVRRVEKEKNALQAEGDDLAVSLETLQKQKVKLTLSPPHRLLLLYTKEKKNEGAGALEREKGWFPARFNFFPLPSLRAFFPKSAVKAGL